MSTFFSIFETYGYPGILIILLIGIVWFLVNRQKHTMETSVDKGMNKIADKITDSMAEQNKTLVNTINSQNDKLIDYIVNSKQTEQKDHDDMMSERMQLSVEINNKLKDIMNANGADRVLIFEFHNSFKNLNGVPFAKYSCTYEWQKRGIKPIMDTYKNMPFSTIANIIKCIYDEGGWQIVFKTLDKLGDESPTLYSLWNNDNAKSLIYNAMYDTNNQMIGLLVVEYQHEIPEHVNYEELKIDAAQLTSIINLRYKYNKE